METGQTPIWYHDLLVNFSFSHVSFPKNGNQLLDWRSLLQMLNSYFFYYKNNLQIPKESVYLR